MKIVLIIICTVITMWSNMALSQIEGVYGFDDPENQFISCNIHIYPQGFYRIELRKGSEDHFMYLSISYGIYKFNNGKIDLLDGYTGCKMQFEYQNDTIHSGKTFNWLINKKFIKRNLIYDDFFNTAKIRPLDDLRQEFSRLNKNNNPFDKGIYKSKQGGFSLFLFTNNSYTYEFEGFILSEGEWKQMKNELSLFDTDVKHTFYASIDKEGLICRFSPFLFNSQVLHITEKYGNDETLEIVIGILIVFCLLGLYFLMKYGLFKGRMNTE